MLSFISKILVAYDGSELSKKALQNAIQLAKQNSDIEIDVVTVFHNPTNYIGYSRYDVNLHERMREEAEKILKEAEAELHKEKLQNKIKTHLLEGYIGKMIVGLADENDCDLIIIGSRGLSGLKELFLGSVSHYVAQHAHCPVLIIK